jgi:hypothetical protein
MLYLHRQLMDNPQPKTLLYCPNSAIETDKEMLDALPDEFFGRKGNLVQSTERMQILVLEL